MKNNLYAIALIGLMLCNTVKTYGQATSAGNSNNPLGPNEFLGWANGNNIAVDIMNKNNYPIDFYTGSTPVKYMTILGSTNPGFVGIGIATPQNKIHLDAGSLQITNATTGSSASSDGLLIGQSSSGSTNVEINQQENAPMNFLTNNAARLKIQSDGKVALGNYTTFTANSLLHQYVNSATETYHQFTNSTTGASTGTTGLQVGIDANGNAIFKNNYSSGSNGAMNFYTNGTERMRISNSGLVGIGTSTINSQLTLDNNYATSGTGQGIDLTTTGTGVDLTGLKSITTGTGSTTGHSNRALILVTSSSANAYNYGADITVTGTGLAALGIRNIVNGVSGLNNAGIYSECNNGNNTVAVRGKSTGGTIVNHGALFEADGNASQTYNIGVEGRAVNADGLGNLNIGVEGYSDHNNSHTAPCYGILGYVNVPQTGDYAGYFLGDVHATGNITSGSDQILKDNITDLTGSLALLNQLNPKTYNFRKTDYPDLNLPSGIRFGLIAQDVELVLPVLVGQSTMQEYKDAAGNLIHPSMDFKTMNYIELIPILIAAIKEQQLQIDALNSQLKSGNTTGELQQDKGKTTVELTNAQTVYLSNAIPNPFVDNATIKFSIPENVKTAQIIFTENNGIVLKSVTIEQRGESSLTVFGENLSKGIYSYSLIIDGKVFETKKMVKQ